MELTPKQREHADKRASSVRKSARQVVDTVTGEIVTTTKIDVDSDPRNVVIINKKRAAMTGRFVMIALATADLIRELREKKQWSSRHDTIWTEVQGSVKMGGHFKLNLSRLSRNSGWSRTELRTAVKQMIEWKLFYQLPPVNSGSVGEYVCNPDYIWAGSWSEARDAAEYFQNEVDEIDIDD